MSPANTPDNPNCSRGADADRRARWFSRLFFLRDPLAAEEEEFAGAVQWARRRWLWLLAGYLAFLALAVLPALLRDRNAAYYATAIAVPHLLLYLVTMMVAYGWVGYRINLSTMKEHVGLFTRRQGRRLSYVVIGVWALVGGVVGFLTARVGSGIWENVDLWFRETFTTPRLIVLFALLLAGFPEVIARLRLREHQLGQRIAATEAASEKLARQTAESELRLLQAQVEPHFLYNTLANLRYLIQKGSPEALRMTDALIEYLRTAVPDMRAVSVTLGRETDHVRNFLDVMGMRMQGRLQWSVDVDAALREVPLPPLVLLTLVENAIKHGVGPLVEGGQVTVTVRADGEQVAIEVADTGAGLRDDRAAQARGDPVIDSGAAAMPSTQAGLANARGRLWLTYGTAATIELLPNTPRGTRARLRIPRVLPAAADMPRQRVVTASRGQEPEQPAPAKRLREQQAR